MIPASPTQQGIWFTERACRVDSAYQMPLDVHLDGDVDLPALRAALSVVLERHPVLGQAIAERDGVPYLVPATRPPELTEVDGETARPFDLAAGPLFRCALVRRAGGVTLRVVVHELVHRVAPDLSHAGSGVMQGDLGRSFLTRKQLSLDDGSRSAVLAALREARRAGDTANHLSPGPRTK